MGLEAVFQYSGLLCVLLSPLFLFLCVLPFDITTWKAEFDLRNKREKKINFFFLSFWWFIAILGLSLLLYAGGVFELVRFGGSYMGWRDNVTPIVISSLGFLFSIIWLPFWFLPIKYDEEQHHFNVTPIQILAIFFTLIGWLWATGFTKSGWCMVPLFVFDFIVFCSTWNHDEYHRIPKYVGPRVNAVSVNNPEASI